MNLQCPLCRRTAWLTQSGLADHLSGDHGPHAVAEELAKRIAVVEQPQAPKNGCHKIRYATESDARAELVGALMAHNRGNPKRLECRVYQCDRCSGWHLTSQPKPLERNAG